METPSRSPESRDRQWVTFRLWPKDRERWRTIADHSEETPDRYTALQHLTPIIRALELEDVRGLKREALRVGIPAEVHELLQERSHATGLKITDILGRAIEQYIREHSTPHNEGD